MFLSNDNHGLKFKYFFFLPGCVNPIEVIAEMTLVLKLMGQEASSELTSLSFALKNQLH